MNALIKGAMSVLIALIILALIGTGVIIYYNTKQAGAQASSEDTGNDNLLPEEEVTIPASEESTTASSTQETESATKATDTNHKHDYTATVSREATCTVIGKMLYTCKCGSHYIETIPSLSHTPGTLTTVREATKQKDGLKQQRCTVCNTVLKEEAIPKIVEQPSSSSAEKESKSEEKKHNYESEVTKEPTCTQNGIRTYKCKDKGCKEKYEEDIPGLNHPSRQTIITDPTCKKDGSSITSCAICKAIISNDVLKAYGGDHDFGSWKTTKKATKDAAGEKTRTCEICDEKETKTIPKLTTGDNSSGGSGDTGNTGNSGSDNNHTHSYTSTITTAVTCTTDGVTTFKCSCGDNYTETIEKLGHNPGNWKVTKEPTPEAPGERKKLCRRCGADVDKEEIPYVPAHTEHSLSSTIIKSPTCVLPGTKRYTCSECSYYYDSDIPATGQHTKKPDSTSSTQYRCSVCGKEVN